MTKALICFQKKPLIGLQIIHVKRYNLIYKKYLQCNAIEVILSVFNAIKEKPIFVGGLAAQCRIAKSYIAYAIEIILSVFNVVKEKPNFFDGFATN